MKSHFKEFYSLTPEEVKAVWDGDPLVVLDTNILLNPYRYSKDTTEGLFKILESDALKDKLWIPYQVALEYQNNRLRVYYENWNAVELISSVWKAKMDDFKKDTQKYWNRNPFFTKEAFEGVVTSVTEKVQEEMDKWKQNVEDYLNEDSIRDRITTLYEGKVGDDYTWEELQNLYKEGDKRFKDKIPPGFKDDTKAKSDQGLRHVFGDLIVWKQLIKKAKDDGKNIIFVSGDQKIDWWEEWHGKKLRPRVELVKEFRDETRHEIIFYTQLGFMKYAKENLGLNTTEATINEVKTVDTADAEESIEERRKYTEDILKKMGFMPNPNAARSAVRNYNPSIAIPSVDVWNEIREKSTTDLIKDLALAQALKKYTDLGQIGDAITKSVLDHLVYQQNLTNAISKMTGENKKQE